MILHLLKEDKALYMLVSILTQIGKNTIKTFLCHSNDFNAGREFHRAKDEMSLKYNILKVYLLLF